MINFIITGRQYGKTYLSKIYGAYFKAVEDKEDELAESIKLELQRLGVWESLVLRFRQ